MEGENELRASDRRMEVTGSRIRNRIATCPKPYYKQLCESVSKFKNLS